MDFHNHDWNWNWNLIFMLKMIAPQYPTKALAPLMLEDYRKVMVERRGEEEQFTSEHIVECMKKGTWISFFCISIFNLSHCHFKIIFFPFLIRLDLCNFMIPAFTLCS